MSAAPLLKTVWVNLSAFKDQPQLIQDALKAGSQDDACLHLYEGPQVEDPNTAGWISTWKSQAEHDAVLTAPNHPARAFQSNIFAGAGTENGPKVTMATLVDPLETLEKALTSPYTEVTELRLKPGESQSDYDARMLKGVTSLKAAGAYAVARTVKVGDPTTYVVAAGWNSRDEHFAAIADGTEAGNDLKHIAEIASLEAIRHVKLSQFK